MSLFLLVDALDCVRSIQGSIYGLCGLPCDLCAAEAPKNAIVKNNETVCWALGLSRKTDIPFYRRYNGWIFTDSMVDDINSSAGISEKLPYPEPGCIVVYGAGRRIGHVGIVSQVQNGAMKSVIDCSAGNSNTFNSAIQETRPSIFNRPDTLWGKYVG